MARKVILLTDPGIDGAFAIALALHDPELDVLGLAATAGNVSAEQATQNDPLVVEQLDPPRLPRVGAALPVEYETDGTRLHGHNGLGGLSFPCAELHHLHSSDKLITDLIRQYPKEVTIVALGPLTVLARALDRDPTLPEMVQQIVCVGGAWREPGNASAVAEFHFFCDPASARQVLRCGAPVTLIPLDVSRKLLFAPTDLLQLPAPSSRASTFLRQIVPFGIRATASLHGVEGFHLKDVVGILAASQAEALTTKPSVVDVETRGELTRGMTVIDRRWGITAKPNLDLAVDVDTEAARAYITATLERAA